MLEASACDAHMMGRLGPHIIKCVCEPSTAPGMLPHLAITRRDSTGEIAEANDICKLIWLNQTEANDISYLRTQLNPRFVSVGKLVLSWFPNWIRQGKTKVENL